MWPPAWPQMPAQHLGPSAPAQLLDPSTPAQRQTPGPAQQLNTAGSSKQLGASVSSPQLSHSEPAAQSNVSTYDQEVDYISDGQDSDCEEDGDYKEADPAKSSRWKETREVFKELQTIFPDKFKTKDVSNVPYFDRVLQDPTNVPLLQICPNIAGSWLDPFKTVSSTDEVHFWPTSVKLPPKPSAPFPPKLVQKPDKRHSDIAVPDEALRAMLEAGKLGSIPLDPAAFQVTKVDVSRSSMSSVDYLLRSSLYDAFVTDELLAIILQLIPHIQSSLGVEPSNPASSASPTWTYCLVWFVWLLIAIPVLSNIWRLPMSLPG